MPLSTQVVVCLPTLSAPSPAAQRRVEGLRLKTKSEMLLTIAPLDRGAAASPEKRAAVEQIALKLQACEEPLDWLTLICLSTVPARTSEAACPSLSLLCLVSPLG